MHSLRLPLEVAQDLRAVGGFYGSVANFSLDRYREPREESQQQSDTGLRLPTLMVVPVDGGAMVTASF